MNNGRLVMRRVSQYLPFNVRRIINFLIFARGIPVKIFYYSPGNREFSKSVVEYRRNPSLYRSRLLLTSKIHELPTIDISVVTYNNSQWIDAFVDSLSKLSYEKNKLAVFFVDHSSDELTLEKLKLAIAILGNAGIKATVKRQKNYGFGSGHNFALKDGVAPFCLVTNLDLTFERDTLTELVLEAISDAQNVAVWETRQRPYEHPKYYDPITGLTCWNSHACVLIRRSAYQTVGSYDENIFMYGEDVELSYRLRRAGFLLKYCPRAVVVHNTYEYAGQVKPLQSIGGIFANFYIRLKYGAAYDILFIIFLAVVVLCRSYPYKNARRLILKEYWRLLKLIPVLFCARLQSSCSFPFRGLGYEFVRPGGYYNSRVSNIETGLPLISVITRSYNGRNTYLAEALIAVASQTYLNIEHVVVEDGGTSLSSMVNDFRQKSEREINYVGLPTKGGRSVAGNAGLEAAKGEYCIFLDDDDLLFAEHIEILYFALLQAPNAVAAYAPALEIMTLQNTDIQKRYTEMWISAPLKLMHPYDYESLKRYNFMAIQSVLFKRTLFSERGGFEEDMDALEDWNLWMRYGFKNEFTYVAKATSLFRTPSKSSSIAKRQLAFDSAYLVAIERFEKWQALFKKGNPR